MKYAPARTILIVTLLGAAGCSTDRRYPPSAAAAPTEAGAAKSSASATSAGAAEHEKVVQAVLRALHEEANLQAGQIRRTDEERTDALRVTRLEAAYTHYSRVRAEVVTDPRARPIAPKVKVKVRTREILHTRHRDWEKRILERVAIYRQGKQYGPETLPTALPAEAVPEPKELPVNDPTEPKR